MHELALCNAKLHLSFYFITFQSPNSSSMIILSSSNCMSLTTYISTFLVFMLGVSVGEKKKKHHKNTNPKNLHLKNYPLTLANPPPGWYSRKV